MIKELRARYKDKMRLERERECSNKERSHFFIVVGRRAQVSKRMWTKRWKEVSGQWVLERAAKTVSTLGSL